MRWPAHGRDEEAQTNPPGRRSRQEPLRVKVTPSPGCGCSSCTVASVARGAGEWAVPVLQANCPPGEESKQLAACGPTGPALARRAHRCGKPEITGSRFPVPPFLDIGLPGAKRMRARSQEALLDAISSAHCSERPSKAPGRAWPCMASVPSREGMAAPGRATQHYMRVTGLAAFVAFLRPQQLGTSGAKGPRAGPATMVLLPGRGQLLCGSHQPQLQRCFPEGWVICLPCFACLRLPRGQGDAGYATCPLRGAQPRPSPQGRAGRGAKPPPPQHAEHPEASPGLEEGRWGMQGRIRTRQDLSCGSCFILLYTFCHSRKQTAGGAAPTCLLGSSHSPLGPLGPHPSLPCQDAPCPGHAFDSLRSCSSPRGAPMAPTGLRLPSPACPQIQEWLIQPGGHSCLGVTEQPQPHKLGRLRLAALPLRIALASPWAAVPRTEAEQLHPSPELPAGCGPRAPRLSSSIPASPTH